MQATGGNNGEIEAALWPEGKRIASLKGHTGAVLSLAVDSKQELMATAGADAIVCLWDTNDFICLKTFTQMDFPIRALGFSHDSRYLAMVGEGPCVFVEDLSSGASLGSLTLRTNPEDCSWSPTSNVLAYPIDLMNEYHVQLRFQKS